mmetsp:Transcript_61196/g.121170  ORF Transcript_61196/g.121170 Transcript_61196/m.121170 type:complete len:96 (-) Transcript_61196:112-399(-)
MRRVSKPSAKIQIRAKSSPHRCLKCCALSAKLLAKAVLQQTLTTQQHDFFGGLRLVSRTETGAASTCTGVATSESGGSHDGVCNGDGSNRCCCCC